MLWWLCLCACVTKGKHLKGAATATRTKRTNIKVSMYLNAALNKVLSSKKKTSEILPFKCSLCICILAFMLSFTNKSHIENSICTYAIFFSFFCTIIFFLNILTQHTTHGHQLQIVNDWVSDSSSSSPFNLFFYHSFRWNVQSRLPPSFFIFRSLSRWKKSLNETPIKYIIVISNQIQSL